MRKYLKVVGWSIVIICILITVRIGWVTIFEKDEAPNAINGVLNLTSTDLPSRHSISLNGEWSFYPNVFLEDSSSTSTQKGELVEVPEKKNRSKKDSFYYGTYKLQIILNEEQLNKGYTIQVNNVHSSSQLFINGKLVGSSGTPAKLESDYVAQNIAYSVNFVPEDKVVDVQLYVAHENGLNSGVRGDIRFATEEAFHFEKLFSTSSELMAAGIFLIHSLYAGFIYFLSGRQKDVLYFSLLTFGASLIVLMSDNKLLFQFYPFSYSFTIKSVLIVYTVSSLFLFQFLKNIGRKSIKIKYFNWYPMVCIAFVLFVVFGSTKLVREWTPFVDFILLTVAIASIILLLDLVKTEVEDSMYIIFGAVAIGNNIVMSIIKDNFFNYLPFYPVDFLVGLFFFSIYWFKRYFKNTQLVVNTSHQLRRHIEEKDHFLAATAHSIRYPLRGMINIAQSMKEDPDIALSEKNKENMKLLMDIGSQMSVLINDLLDLTMLKESKIKLEKKTLNLYAIVGGVMDMLKPLLQGKPIQMKVMAKEFPEVIADEARTVQVLFNLLHNAVKYTEKGTIEIGAKPIHDGMVSIYIADTGKGIEEEQLQTIFTPYQQNEENHSIESGIGLGLAVSKQLVELHGGTLTVKSVKGKGSIFTFTLPAASQQNNSLEVIGEKKMIIDGTSGDFPVTLERKETKKGNILIVDDDPINLQVARNILSNEGYQIVTALNGDQALDLLNKDKWDLVISDVIMPYMSGYELTKVIRDKFTLAELPILLVTARNRPEDIYSSFQSGANDYVTKPVDAQELKMRVRSLMDLKQSIRERLTTEAALLQAQIKPHFLFNTLNTILMLQEIDQEKMKHVFNSFIYYLQESFSFENTEQETTFQHEMALVRAYLTVEEVRFGARLKVKWNIKDGIDFEIPPLIIQTLVENALNHGILKKASGGEVIISCVEEATYYTVSIQDNGRGIEQQPIRNLLEKRKKQPIGGLGLYNCNQRLIQLYGKGLQIESSPNVGTKVLFTIPKKGII